MKLVEIEAWAHRVMDAVKTQGHHEDSRVELKADWPSAQLAARRVAGQANAARGAPILWLIGFDEGTGTVTGVQFPDLAAWWAQVEACFDGLAPVHLEVHVPRDGLSVAALYVESDNAPFVVRNPAFGTLAGHVITHEVPWRDGTKIRSARREDLVRLLGPMASLPRVEVLSADARLVEQGMERNIWYEWWLRVGLYMMPAGKERVVIPFHNCEVTATVPVSDSPLTFDNIRMKPPRTALPGGGSGSLSVTVLATEDEVILDGAGKVHLNASASFFPKQWRQGSLNDPVRVTMSLLAVDALLPVKVSLELTTDHPEQDEKARGHSAMCPGTSVFMLGLTRGWPH